MHDWTPVAALCRNQSQRLHELVSTVTDQIRAEVPEYLTVPRTEHLTNVGVQIAALLDAVADARPQPRQS